MKKITVMLSGSGIYGYSGIALMEFFYKNQIKPNLILGCSSGALVAALWAKGFSPQETLEKITEAYRISQDEEINLSTLFYFFGSPLKKQFKLQAILKVDRIQKLYHDFFGTQKIEHLPIQTVFQTTNAKNGETYYVKEGLLADAVYASSAILPFYPPIKMDDKWLVDGVFSESLPLKFMVDEYSDVIVSMLPNDSSESNEKNFMHYYSNFVQKALNKASSSRRILTYDLHNSEIVLIPIEIQNKKDDSLHESIKQILDSSRKFVSNKEDSIFSSLRSKR